VRKPKFSEIDIQYEHIKYHSYLWQVKCFLFGLL
jgi:hypothetical protein